MDVDLLTVSKAAELLKLSAGAVYALCKSGALPHHRLGAGRGTIRIDRADLLAYLAACKHGAAPNESGPMRPRTPAALPSRATPPMGFKHLRLDRLLGGLHLEGDPPVDPDGHSAR
jgi:excisionase family DNA binding protein